MRLLLAAATLAVLLSTPAAEAGPFGPNRSEGAPPTPKKLKKQKGKKAKPPARRAVDDERPSEPTRIAGKKAKPPAQADDEELVVIEEAPAKPVEAKATPPKVKVAATKPAKTPKPAKAAPKPAIDEDDGDIVVTEEPPAKRVNKGRIVDDDAEEEAAPAKPAKQLAIAAPRAGARSKPAKATPVEPSPDDELVIIEEAPAGKPAADTEDDGDPPRTRVATADDEDALDDVAVTKTTTRSAPHKTRFYFRAGAMKQSTKLGATEFSLQTQLPVDTSSLGAGSGVETQQNQIPVGAIVGVVLPVANRKLSLETVLGIPTPTRFQATGKLATESLAPTFMGMETGIEPLGADLGEVTFAPPIVTAVYRVAKLGPVTPIAGAGVMVLMGRNAKITNAVLQEAGDPKLSIKPSPGLVVQGGLDITLWKRVAARIDVKYVLGMKVNATIEDIAVTPKAIPTLGSIEVGDAVMSAKVAPLIVQAGVGVDF